MFMATVKKGKPDLRKKSELDFRISYCLDLGGNRTCNQCERARKRARVYVCVCEEINEDRKERMKADERAP